MNFLQSTAAGVNHRVACCRLTDRTTEVAKLINHLQATRPKVKYKLLIARRGTIYSSLQSIILNKDQPACCGFDLSSFASSRQIVEHSTALSSCSKDLSLTRYKLLAGGRSPKKMEQMEHVKMEPQVEPVVEPVRMASIIDAKSMLEYKRQYEMYSKQNKNASKEEVLGRLEGYIKKKIDDMVKCESRKRVMDISTVAVSTGCSMVIPFSGVAPVVAATVIQCLMFAMALGLIPLLNVRSFNDLNKLSRQVGMTIKRSSKSGLWAGIETAVIEILKELGVGDWLWTDILKDVLIEIVGEGASGAAWIVSPILAVPKYMLHRHTIKRMYRKLGDRAILVHTKWAELGVTVPVLVVEATVVEATVLEEVQVGATPPGISAPTATATATNPQPGKNNPAAMNPPRKTIIFGYTPPSNSSFFQPQIQGVSLPNPGSQPFYFQPQAAAPKAADQYNFNVIPTAQPTYYNFQPRGYPPPTSQPNFMNSAPPVGMAFYTQGVPTYPPQFGTTMYPPPAAAAFQPKFQEDTISKQGNINSSGVNASKITDFKNYGYPQQVMGYQAQC